MRQAKPTENDIVNVDAMISQLKPEAVEFLQDIFHTFFEDYGTNSWRQVVAYRWHEREPKRWYGIILEIGDGDLEKEYMVNLATIREGLHRIDTGKIGINSQMYKNIYEAMNELDAGMIDAYDADMIVQAGLFNELRYG